MSHPSRRAFIDHVTYIAERISWRVVPHPRDPYAVTLLPPQQSYRTTPVMQIAVYCEPFRDVPHLYRGHVSMSWPAGGDLDAKWMRHALDRAMVIRTNIYADSIVINETALEAPETPQRRAGDAA